MFWLSALGVVISLMLAFLVNQLPPIPRMARWARLTMTSIAFALGIAATALLSVLISNGEHSGDPLVVEIVSPSSGDTVDRPFTPAVAVQGEVGEGHSLWLAYRNQLGGPYVIQALRCSVQNTRLDCGGAVYLGAGEEDSAAFRLFVIEADEPATIAISNAAKAGPQEPGRNFTMPDLPDGASVLSPVSNLRLRSS